MVALRESVSALQDLIQQNPRLQPVLRDHLEGYGGELIPTLLIAEIVDWMVDHRSEAGDVVASVIRWMNHSYPTATDELRNVIATGGVEAMPSPGQPGHELRDLLSPELQATDPWS